MNTPSGTILKFRYYSEQQLLQVKEQLTLAMTKKMLAQCAEHYRTVEKRDPTVDELLFLDALAQKASDSLATRPLTRLFTNDAHVAQTYSDLLQKHRALSTDILPPATPIELSQVATRYLAYAGKAPSLPHHVLTVENRHNISIIPAADCGCGISSSPYQLRILSKKNASKHPEVGDSVVLLTPCEESSLDDYQERIGKLLNAYGQAAPWKYFCNVTDKGLLPALLSVNHLGFWIDVSRLADERKESALFYLTEAFAGCHLAITSHPDTKELIERAEEYGVRAITPATATREATVSAVLDGYELFTIDVAFIRRIITPRPMTARLSDESSVPLQTIEHIPTTPDTCQSLQNFLADCIPLDGTVCAAAFCKPDADLFRHALFTVLCPVLRLAASGHSYTAQRLAIGVGVPELSNDERAYGNLLSALLGIYRAQAELAIPADAMSIQDETDASYPQITVFSVAKGKQGEPSSRFADAGNPVYCFAPPIDARGIPNFAELRKLLERLCELAADHTICSARVLCGEAIVDGLGQMEHNGLYCHVDEKIVPGELLSLAILVECRRPLSGQTPIGAVVQSDMTPIVDDLTPPTPLDEDITPLDQAIPAETIDEALAK